MAMQSNDGVRRSVKQSVHFDELHDYKRVVDELHERERKRERGVVTRGYGVTGEP